MSADYSIVYEEAPDQATLDIVGQGLRAFNRQQVGEHQQPFQPLCYSVRAADQAVVGGILAATYWSWLYIDALWVVDIARGRGYGLQLMVRAEQEARRRGATHAYLDTFSFQAPQFYQRLGYQIFGTLPDFPPGQTRYFLTKPL